MIHRTTFPPFTTRAAVTEDLACRLAGELAAQGLPHYGADAHLDRGGTPLTPPSKTHNLKVYDGDDDVSCWAFLGKKRP